jgi:hypothetical protein
VAQAHAIDRENGDTLWWDVIVMEMKNIRPAFEKYEKKESDLIGYQKISCHFWFLLQEPPMRYRIKSDKIIIIMLLLPEATFRKIHSSWMLLHPPTTTIIIKPILVEVEAEI